MTRKLLDTILQDGKSRKRIQKPVVEKKRRDRINQSLAELRRLLLSHTSDPRLQNPKIEKAEILDLAVEHVQKWTNEKNLRKASTDGAGLRHSGSYAAPLLTVEGAGFRQCVAQLTGYMRGITPAQRSSLMEGLKRHTESQQPADDDTKPAAGPDGPSLDCTWERREEPPKFPSHSPFQPPSCSTPFHDYLSPPPSPWLSPSFSTFATSPPFPSFGSHFSFPPSLSPLSSNTPFFTFSPTTASHSSPPGLHCPPHVTLRPPPHAAAREGSPPNSPTSMWRPWIC